MNASLRGKKKKENAFRCGRNRANNSLTISERPRRGEATFSETKELGGIEKRDTDCAMWLQIFRGNCKPHVVAHTLASRGLQVNNFYSCAVVSRPNAPSEFLEARAFKDRPAFPPSSLSTDRRCSRDTQCVFRFRNPAVLLRFAKESFPLPHIFRVDLLREKIWLGSLTFLMRILHFLILRNLKKQI